MRVLVPLRLCSGQGFVVRMKRENTISLSLRVCDSLPFLYFWVKSLRIMFTHTKPIFEARFIVGSESLLKGTLKSERKKKNENQISLPGPHLFCSFVFQLRKSTITTICTTDVSSISLVICRQIIFTSQWSKTHILCTMLLIFLCLQLAAWIFSVR